MSTTWRSAVLLVALLLGACGGGGGEDADPPVPAGMVGPAGGTVSGPGGAQVVIPAGALTQNTAIAVAQSSNGAPALPAGAVALGQMFAFTPHGTAFQSAVTVTVPFDPASVPAGATPLLYKTNAAMGGWDEVAGATVSGDVMSAQITSFSYLTVATRPPEPAVVAVDRYWRFQSLSRLNGPIIFDGPWQYWPGGTLYKDYIYSPPSPQGDGARVAAVFSDDTGKTYWVSAESPRGDPSNEASVFGNEAGLHQFTAYRVLDPNATLKFVVTQLTLEAFDGNVDPPTGWECPNPATVLSPEDCSSTLLGDIAFDINVSRIHGSKVEENVWYIEAGAGLQGWANHWEFGSDGAEEYAFTKPYYSERAFTSAHFEFDRNVDHGANQLHARARLLAPVPITVPLPRLANSDESTPLEVGDILIADVMVRAYTQNWRQRESWINAYFRDPQDLQSGVKIETTGLVQVDVPDVVISPRPPQPSAPECATGTDPEAGVLQFDVALVRAVESEYRGAKVVISRTGGSRGWVSATFSASDGTARADLHYTPVTGNVGFADGETGTRVVRIQLLPDALPNEDRTVRLALSDPRGCAALGERTSAELLILDDDRPATTPPATYTIGGTVSGLAGSGLALTNGSSSISPANGPFTFPISLADGAAYDLRVSTQPSNPVQICTVTNGSGTIHGANVTDITVACVTPLPNGSLDPEFGSGGKVTNNSLRPAFAMARQADGKFVVLSELSKLSRYDADGTQDLGFGTNGVVAVSFTNNFDIARAVALQADGKIVVAGRSIAGTFDDFGVERFNADGTLDTGFGTNGKLSIDLNGSFDDAQAVMIQADGKIVVAGTGGTVTGLGVDSDFAAVRLLEDGTLDATFGTGGRTLVNIAGRADLVNTALLQPDGKLLLAGRVGVDGGAPPDTGLVRLTTLGSPDAGFGNGSGIKRIDLSRSGHDYDEASDVALTADGRIIVAVVTQGLSVYEHTLAGLDTVGSLDLRFGSNGFVRNSFAAGGDFARAIAIQADGRIVTAGSTRPTDSLSDDLLITRHDANGTLDGSFGTGGKVIVDFFGSADGATCLVIQPDGKIVTAGIARNAGTNSLALVRVLP